MENTNNLRVCIKCLYCIECHEGKQAVMPFYIDVDEPDIICEWCGEWANTLYELI